MDICNCHLDLNAFFCDIPNEWREGIVNALCFVLQPDPITCDQVKKCETITSMPPFTVDGNILNMFYKNEKGYTKKSSVDISDILENALDGINPKCVMTQNQWNNSTLEEKLQGIITSYCTCCPPTTTSSTTTTTTTLGYDYYLADRFSCIFGNCVFQDTGHIVAVPIGFNNIPGKFYPASPTNSANLYQLLSLTAYNVSAIVLNVAGGSLLCTSFCNTTSTTTSTSTTSTTTVAPTSTTTTTSTSTTTTSTSTTTTSTSSTTTSTTTSPPNLLWVADEKVCETEGGFGIVKTITGVASPITTWFDTVTNRLYVADIDDPSGNIYWFTNIATATTVANATHSIAINYDPIYNAAFDPLYRRCYLVGKNTGGMLVYDINSDTSSLVLFGTNFDFSRTVLFVSGDLIICNDGNTNLILIDRSSLAIINTVPTSGLTNPEHFDNGPYNFVMPSNGNLYVASANGNSPNIGVYDTSLNHITEITLPGASAWTFGNYWQTIFWDSVSDKIFVSDAGSSLRYVINPATNTVIDTRVQNDRQGKTNCFQSATVDPLTNNMYMAYSGLNSSSDNAGIFRVYKLSRTTYDFLNMYEGSNYDKLGSIPTEGWLAGVNRGGVHFNADGGYAADGTITILSNALGSDNTGTQLTITLKQVDANNGNAPTGQVKANVPFDADYVPPSDNDPDCPPDVNLDCPTDAVTTFINASDTMYYEFALPNSVKNNPGVNNIAVFAYNTGTSLTEGSPQVYTSLPAHAGNYYSGTLIGLTGSAYTIRILYRNGANATLATCTVS